MRDGFESYRAELDGLRRRVAEPLERLRRAKEKTGEGLALALYGFLEEIDLPRRLLERGAELRQGGEAALAAEYEQLARDWKPIEPPLLK